MYTSGPMARVQLYVRSKRTSIVTGHVSVETIGAVHTTAEYAEGRTLAQLPQQDATAKDFLRKSGLKFDVVDLSEGIWTRLGARLKGVRQTPTLLDRSRSPQLLVGLKEISEYATRYKNTRLS